MVRLALIENEADLGGFPDRGCSRGADIRRKSSRAPRTSWDRNPPRTSRWSSRSSRWKGAAAADVLKACRAVPDPPAVLLVAAPELHGRRARRDAAGRLRLCPQARGPARAGPPHRPRPGAAGVEARVAERSPARSAAGTGSPLPSARSLIMQDFLARARKAAASSSTVLILGETGIGKDVIARYIQSTGSARRQDLPDAQLRGGPGEPLRERALRPRARRLSRRAHVEGRSLRGSAWRHALPRRDRLDGAAGADQSAPRPRRRSRAKARREAPDQGGRAPDRGDQPGPGQPVAAGEFREDLYYRVSVVTSARPPLRKRPEDIEPLARLFLAESVRRHRKLRVFAPGTLEMLRSYSYPGNIRELRYAIEHAGSCRRTGSCAPRTSPSPAPAGRRAPPPRARRTRTRPIAQEISPERLQQVLREQGGNRVRAARALQISRATLYRLLDRTSDTPVG